jgi:oligoribonuclease
MDNRTHERPCHRPAASAELAKSEQNLVWLDCEMTGLDPEKERIIEIAVIVTGPQLTPRVEGPVLVIHQPTRC